MVYLRSILSFLCGAHTLTMNTLHFMSLPMSTELKLLDF